MRPLKVNSRRSGDILKLTVQPFGEPLADDNMEPVATAIVEVEEVGEAAF
jgi:hypothetical protein